MKYKVVREESVRQLVDSVQTALDDGFDLADNGLIIMPNGTGFMYVREMVKYEGSDQDAWEILLAQSKQYDTLMSES